MSVSMKPGCDVVTTTPAARNCSRMPSASIRTAALLAPYTGELRETTSPVTELMNSTPPRLRVSIGANAPTSAIGPKTFTSNTSRVSASLVSRTGPAGAKPALLTSTSTSAAAAAAAAMSDPRVTSSRIGTSRSPCRVAAAASDAGSRAPA